MSKPVDATSDESAHAPRERGGLVRFRPGLLLTLFAIGLAAMVFIGKTSTRSPDSATASRRSAETVPDASRSDESPGKVASSSAAWGNLDNPAADGWDTEVFAGAALGQLKELGEWIKHPHSDPPALAAESARIRSLRPRDLATSVDDGLFLVQRPTVDATIPATVHGADGPSTEVAGAAGLEAALRELAAPFLAANDVRYKFKIFRVMPDGDAIATHAYFALSGRIATGMIEENSTWIVRWQPNGREPPLLQSVNVARFERVTIESPTGTLFADCTQAVIGDTDGFQAQLAHGFNYWLERKRSPR